MKVSIHQPNFMPWYPFFQKMEDSDIFVILENCQFEKNNFQNRFKKDEQWYTMSVNKGLTAINTKKYLNPLNDWVKIKNKLKEYDDVLSLFDDCIVDDLSITNSNIIIKIKEILGLETKILFDYPTNLKSTERLVDICETYGATKYISGPSGKKYLDETLFQKRNIKVIYQNTEMITPKPIIDILKNKI